jgi:UPF0755 protein
LSERRRLAFLLTLLGITLLLAASFQYSSWMKPYRGYQGESAIVVIAQGSSPGQVAQSLHDAGIIRGQMPFTFLTRLRGVSSKLKAGEYVFDRPMTLDDVIERIVRGEVLLHRVTIPEGLSGPEILERIARLRLVRRAELDEAFRDPAPIRDLDPQARDLEGYLFPETYRFARGTSAKKILGEMVERFREAYAESVGGAAATMGMSARQVVTLASLIEKETSIAEERGRVSAVFHNRLRLGMPLQCDPTVIYALNVAGRPGAQLTRDDLGFVSPYNTYVNTGLPPGPIASPGRASLAAAIRPAPVRDLYFVADGTGGHFFSDTLEEHERAVSRYRRLRRAGV